MTNEETIIMQPQGGNQKQNSANAKQAETKAEQTTGASKVATAATAAGVFGGALGGAGSVAAANVMSSTDESEEVTTEEAQQAEDTSVQQTTTEAVNHTIQSTTPVAKTEPATEEIDYTNHAGADPVVNINVTVHTDKPEDVVVETEGVTVETTNEPVQITGEESTSDVPEVQVLGVYERTTEDGVHQEMVMLSNGEEVAAVLDADGDGQGDLLAVDENHDGQFQDGEIYDISGEEGFSMSAYEQEYMSQQQHEEMNQQEMISYDPVDESDYNNDVDLA